MTKEELRLLIAAGTAEYNKPILTHAMSAAQRDKVKRGHYNPEAQPPQNLREADYRDQLEQTKQGKHQHKPGHDIWLTEYVPGTGKLRYELED